MIGKAPLCNGKPERAPHIGSFCFPLCWRCLMIDVGLLVGAVLQLLFVPGLAVALLSSLLMIPCLIDGLKQKYTDYVSSNPKRAVFGLIAGIGMFVSFYSIGSLLIEQW